MAAFFPVVQQLFGSFGTKLGARSGAGEEKVTGRDQPARATPGSAGTSASLFWKLVRGAGSAHRLERCGPGQAALA